MALASTAGVAVVDGYTTRGELAEVLVGLTQVGFVLDVQRPWYGLENGSLVVVERDPASGQWKHPAKNALICGTPTFTYGKPAGRAEGSRIPICMQTAGWGTEHPGRGSCRVHGGKSQFEPSIKHSGLEVLSKPALRREMAALSIPLEIDPFDALLQMVREAAGNVAFLGARVAELGYDLVGDVYALSRDGSPVAVSEEARSLVKLYNEERDRLGRASKLAIDAGIAEREVRVLEDQATLLAQVIRGVFAKLSLDEATMRVAMDALSTELRSLGAGSTPPKNVTESGK